MKVYNTQGLLIIKLDTKIDCSAATLKKILYVNPLRASGEWAAYLIGSNVLAFQLTNASILPTGIWSLQSYVRIGGLDGYGQIVEVYFDKKLK